MPSGPPIPPGGPFAETSAGIGPPLPPGRPVSVGRFAPRRGGIHSTFGLQCDKENHVNDSPKNTDDAKGRVKEAAGNLTGDDDMKDEGKKDQAAGTVKDVADSAKDKVDDGVDKVRGN